MTSLVLGPVLFKDLEIPERLSFGGSQRLAVHRLIGGFRVIDAMGPDESERRWVGRLQGADASDRARLLDTLRTQGAQLPLSFGAFAAIVVISDLELVFERTYQVLYSINVTVVSNDIATLLTVASLDTLVAGDLALAALASSAIVGAAAQAASEIASTFAGGYAQ
jgi:hypothetical protein